MDGFIHALVGSYNYRFIAVSIVIAVLAATPLLISPDSLALRAGWLG
jgi:hypothetical protein